MGKAVLITGTDTGAGKTYVARLLGESLRREGVGVRPLKPVESGCPPGPGGRPIPADATALRDAMAPGLPLDAVCLYPLPSSLSPHLAARLSGTEVDPSRVRAAVIAAAAVTDLLLVEGAGGITVEMRDGYGYDDLARDLSLPVLVVAGNCLGVLNHLKLTLGWLRSRRIHVAGVILNDVLPEPFPAREPNEAEAERIAAGAYLGRVRHGAAVLSPGLLRRFRSALL